MSKVLPLKLMPQVDAAAITGKFDVPANTDNAGASISVGDRVITETEVAREMQHHRSSNPHQARADAARALVVRSLLNQEAARLGLPETVEPEAKETIEEACMRVLIDREVSVPVISDADKRRYFEANRERFHAPDQVNARHILLAAAPDDIDGRLKARTLGDELIAQLREVPERFAEFAQKHSDCPSKEVGGDLGPISRGQTTPEFDRQLFMLKQGLAGCTVESRYGHHVVFVDAINKGELIDLEQVDTLISDYLEIQSRQQAIQHYLLSLEARFPVQGMEQYEPEAA